ncbi:hypothetical protein E4U54_000553 [Claviceps lovelessii]|nr:hypothetical protein E4U54_000553 [Claviceps lovelessii]
MKAFTILSLAASLVAAARPGISTKKIENIDIADFSIQKTVDNGVTKLTHVSFKLSGDEHKDLLCAAENPELLPPGSMNKTYDCVNSASNYRFTLLPGQGNNDVKLHIYHQLGDAWGFQGEGDIMVNCHGLDSPSHLMCGQVNQVTIGITFQ